MIAHLQAYWANECLPVEPLLVALDAVKAETGLTDNALALRLWGERTDVRTRGTGDTSRLRRLRKQQNVTRAFAVNVARAAGIDPHEIGA